MLMNISEKINNSKYNMPLKKDEERKRKSHFIFKPNSRPVKHSTVIARCDVCKIYARPGEPSRTL